MYTFFPWPNPTIAHLFLPPDPLHRLGLVDVFLPQSDCSTTKPLIDYVPTLNPASKTMPPPTCLPV